MNQDDRFGEQSDDINCPTHLQNPTAQFDPVVARFSILQGGGGGNVGERKWLPLGRIISCGRQAGNHADSIYTERESAGMDLHAKSLEQFRDQRREALRVLFVPKPAVAIIAVCDDVIPTIGPKDPQRMLPSPDSDPNSTICQIVRCDPIVGDRFREVAALHPTRSK